MARFFVDRPIVAIVIAIVTVILGLVSMTGLPIAQFPSIIPPQIQIQTTYTGADAVTIEQSVATPLEQQMNGVDKMLYMQSTNANDGTMTLTVTFDVESEVNIDQVNAQNRVSQAQPNLPADVNQFGLTYRSTVGLPLVVISLYSPNGTYDSLFLGNYALINVNDSALSRARGGPGHQLRPGRVLDADLGEARQAGQARHHRARPGPRRPAAEHREPRGARGGGARAQGAAAHLHRARPGAARHPGRVRQRRGARSTPKGSVVRLKDVARVELGALSYNQSGRFNGRPAALIAVFQTPGANALTVADGGQGHDGPAQGALPERPRLPGRPGHHPARSPRASRRSR